MDRSGFAKAGAGALGLLLVGAATGAIKVPGFGNTSPTPPPKPEPPVVTPVKIDPSGGASKGTVSGGAVTATATLGQAKLVRGENGELLIHVGIDATNEVAKERRPIDLSLVLDVSGSMNDQNKIGLLKQACEGVIDKLKDEDRITVAVFSNDARVIFPLENVGQKRAWLKSAIRELTANGGTNLSSGILAGADEMRKVDPRPGSVRRMVVMTDGLANQGLQDQPSLCDLVARLSREGTSISTVGLGLEYNENLLNALAESGGGLYHYANDGERLASIWQAEVEQTRSLVARDARIKLTPSAGVAIDSVYLYPTTKLADGSVEVAIGDMAAGRHAKIVARVRVPTAVEASSVAVASVSLRYQDVRGEKPAAIATGAVALGVELVKDQAVAMASTAKEIKEELKKVQVAYCMDEARKAAIEGKAEEAAKHMDKAFEANGAALLFYDRSDGTKAKLDLLEMKKGLQSRACEAPAPAGMALNEKDCKLASEAQPVGK